MGSVVRLQAALLRKILPAINRRLISTSPKNSETAAAACNTEKAVVNKNWVSYGFDKKNEASDRNAMHSTFFASVTICLVLGGYILMYVPDYNLRDWAQREAFLELRRREKSGLPLIDPNLIAPAKISLPSDEELGETEIII